MGFGAHTFQGRRHDCVLLEAEPTYRVFTNSLGLYKRQFICAPTAKGYNEP